jgi:thiopeptide-type bacteriocin biosynthesis protein
MEMSERRRLANNMSKFEDKTASGSERYRKQLSERFRSERQNLEALLERTAELPPAAQSALARFSERMKTIRTELERLRQAEQLTTSIFELAGSYVHMHLNRLFRSASNAQEIVLYDFLARTCDSRMAREKREAAANYQLTARES